MDLGLWTCLCLALLLAGCSKSPTPNAESDSALLKFHWLGKQRLATEANATNFMAIWNLPESARLEAQTLDKLATAPWRLWQTNVAVSNAPTALLRPLLDDVVQHEVYVEAAGDTNQPGELVLAIRLPAARAALWETNLPPVLQSLAGTNSEARTSSAGLGADFTLHTSHFALNLSRSGDWTLLSFTRSAPPTSPLTPHPSPLLDSFRSRITTTQTPYAARATNYWVEIALDAPKFGSFAGLPWKLPSEFPWTQLTVIGDGQNVRTRGELLFSSAILTNLLPWDLPLQLTLEPLIGLTAARSFKPVLEKMGFLSAAQAQIFPDQLLTWIRSGPPLQMYFAYPLAGGTNAFAAQAQPVVQWINTHAEPRRFGTVVFDVTNQLYRWNGLQLAAPFLRFVSTPTNSFVHGGFGITPAYKPKVPEELHLHVLTATNLLYFDWEHTHDTLPQWRYFDDISRMIFDEAHVSRLRTGRATIGWIQTNLALTNFSHSITEVRLAASNQLVLTRKSTLGLNALELDVVANWIEMPEFPDGLSSLWRTNPAPLLRRATP